MFWICVAAFALLLALNVFLPKFLRRRDSQVIFIAGQIGAGKSAYSVKLARAALKKGKQVYSTDYIEGCYYFDVAWLDAHKCPVNSLLIIDETALKFNSRNFAKLEKSIIEYFKKCRHYKNDVVLISQTFGDTDKQIREISTKVLFMRKFGFITIPVKVKGDITIGDDGQPAIKYKIGRFGKPFVPSLQGKYYNSWEDSSNRPLCPAVTWSDHLKSAVLIVTISTSAVRSAGLCTASARFSIVRTSILSSSINTRYAEFVRFRRCATLIRPTLTISG